MILEAFDADAAPNSTPVAHLKVVHSVEGAPATATIAVFSGDQYDLLREFLRVMADGKDMLTQ